MAEITLKVMSYYSPKSKAVIWAHNMHLSKNGDKIVAVSPSHQTGRKTMGTFLDETLKEEYSPIAFVSPSVVPLDVYNQHELQTSIDSKYNSVESLILKTITKSSYTKILDLNDDFLRENRKYYLGIQRTGNYVIPKRHFRGVHYIYNVGPLKSPLSPLQIVSDPENWEN